MLLSQPLRLPDLILKETAPASPKGLLRKMVQSNCCGIHCKHGQQEGRLDSIALAVSKGVYRIALVCCPNLQRITQRFDSTTFQKETGEATAHTAPALAIHWTSSFKYIPYLLTSMGPIEFNRAVGLKIEDASENFPRASSIFNPTALLNSIGPIELNRVHRLRERNSKDHRLSTIGLGFRA